MLDAIWKARNECKFEKIQPCQESIFQQVHRTSEDWRWAFSEVYPDCVIEASTAVKNIRTLRDHDGKFLGACTRKRKAKTPAEAELLAVEFTVQQQWRSSIFEGDAKEAVEACKEGAAEAPWNWKPVLHNICFLEAMNSSLFRFSP